MYVSSAFASAFDMLSKAECKDGAYNSIRIDDRYPPCSYTNCCVSLRAVFTTSGVRSGVAAARISMYRSSSSFDVVQDMSCTGRINTFTSCSGAFHIVHNRACRVLALTVKGVRENIFTNGMLSIVGTRVVSESID